MSNIKDKVGSGLEKFIHAISSSDVLQAISAGLGSAVGFLLIGSIFSVLRQIPFDGYQTFITDSGLKDIFNIPVQFTTNFFAVIASYTIAYYYSRRKGQDPFIPAILSVLIFFFITPYTVSDELGTVMPFTYLGAQGLFVAMINAILVADGYFRLISHNVYIHMPKSVPAFVEKGFASIVPFAIFSAAAVLINIIFRATSFGNIHAFIYAILQRPLQGVAATPAALIIGTFICQLAWWFGIHGTNAILAGIYMPILMPYNIENLAAYNAGQPLPHLLTFDTLTLNMAGGTGATLGLAIMLALFAKSKQYKTIGRLALIPNIFGVNEPLIFGLPICLNTTFFLPWVIFPTAAEAVGILLTEVGIIAPYNGLHINNFPSFISNFLYTNVAGGLYTIALIFISAFVYWHFAAKKLDQQAYEQEIKEAAEEAVSTETVNA